MEPKNDYPKLDALRIAYDDGGTPVMGFAVTVSLDFRGGETRETRHMLIDIAQSYSDRFEGQLVRYQKSGATRLSPLKQGDVRKAYSAEVDRLDPFYDYHGLYLEAEDPLAPIGLETAEMEGQDAARFPLSQITARFPGTYVEQDPDRIVEMVIEWCNLLHPEQGTVGISLTLEAGMGPTHADLYWPYLKRFVGLDHNWGYTLAMGADRGIKGISWLTILDQAYVDQLGGRDALAKAAGPMVTIYDWDGGVLLRAGAEPQVGDRNMDVWPKAYLAVNAALRPIRFEAYGSHSTELIAVPEPLDNYEETLDWVRRFDRD